jgi:hypothetical protein
MTNDKKVLTPAEFEKITESVSEKIYVLASIYIAILARDAGINFETICTEFGNQSDETELFLEEVNNEYGVDLRSVSEDEFLDKIPESYKDTFKQIKEQYLNSNVKEVSEADSKAYNLLQKEVAIQEDKVARNISNYNLSQIPSDRYAHEKWIRKVNFENTGAKLDLKQFDFNVYITGSIKGCELISFEMSGYRKIIDDGSRENTMLICPSKELLDENQYETVIEGYKDVRTLYITTELCDLLKDPELQKKNEWLFDEAFKGENISYEAWRVLIPELKNKHPEYFESIKNNNRISLYDLSVMILPYTPTTLLEENINWLNSFFRKEDGTIDFDLYIKNIFGYCNSEFQMNHFDELLTEIKDDDETIQQLWAYSREEVKEKNMLKILDAIILEGNVKDSFSFSEIIRNSPKNIPQECLDKVFKLYENENSNIRSYMNIFWENIGKKNQEKYLWPFMQKQKNLGITSYEIYQLWKSTDSIVRYNYFDTVLTQVEKNIPELEHIIKGEGYIDIFFNLPEEKVEQYISNNIPKFLSALRYKYNVSIEGKKDFDSKYDKSFARVLFELEKQSRLNSDNLNIIIDNLPKLGKETINRIFNSNSEMVVNYAPQLISAVANLDKKEAIETIEKIEHIFSQDNLPTFMRIYKYFELVVDKDNSNLLRQISSGQKKDMSPVLSSTRSENLSKRIILADLMKISMDSNNKSLRKFVDKLEKGNEIYVKFVKNGRTIDRLTEDEKQEFKLYIKTIHSLYEESGAYNQDKERGMAISLSGDIQKDAIALGNRYAREGLTNKLSDLALQSIIGPYQELFAGVTTISKIKEYMDNRLEESNKRHRELAKEKLNLEEGDLIKGIRGATGILQDLFEEGIRAGEFLGVDSHSDATPLDTDFSLILPKNNETNLYKTIRNTASSGYGNFFIVLKHSSEKMEFTRTNQSTNIEEESTIVDSIDKRNDSEQIRLRIQNRTNNSYVNKRLEVFASNAVGEDHYGIRTGIGSTDIDYIIVEQWNKKIGYELAMNGTYIPVINGNTEELIFTPEQYDEIRTKMQGLSYYNTGKFVIDETAYVAEAKNEREQLFTSADSNVSTSELEATKNRNAIKKLVETALAEQMGLEVEDHVTGNLQNGFVELIDTGSTGRGTNLPGDGDFDFTLKVDKVILEDPKKMEQLKSALREVLAKPSSEQDSKIEEPNGQFRYKKVAIEGAEKPLDIDITFMQKDGKVTYSTDMCVRDRLEGLKRNNPEGYKYVISNIVLAKRVLKEEGLYKKASSPGATEYGGFGGVGVENWILENGGSFAKAMDTFIETANKSQGFDDFKDKYPIYDFGQNHMAKSYQHDSFVKGLTSQGYARMQERFKELRKELKPIPRVTESNTVTMKNIVKNALQNEEIGIEDVENADRDMANSSRDISVDARET